MIVPLEDRVVLRVEELPERTDGGLYLPEQVRGRSIVCEVLAAGPEAEGLEAGTRVVVAPWAGTTLDLPGGGKVVVVRAEEVLGLWRDDDDRE